MILIIKFLYFFIIIIQEKRLDGKNLQFFTFLVWRILTANFSCYKFYIPRIKVIIKKP